MPHVDDGEIHTYLDGALELLPADDASRIREHLGSCEDCARRVEAQRRIRDRAEALLGAAGPETIVPPPFEEISRRVTGEPEVKSPRWSGTRATVLAWAASLVLALGTGWAVRDLTTGAGRAGVPATSSEIREATEEGAPVGRLAGGQAETPGTDVPSEPSADRADSPSPVRARDDVGARGATAVVQAAEAPAATEQRFRDEHAGEEAEPEALRALAEEAPSAQERFADTATPVEEEGVAEEALVAATDAPAPPRLDQVVPSAAAAFDQGATAERQAGDRDARLVDRVAAGPGPAALMVPGLPVESVASVPGPGGSRIMVVQRLPGGEPLELTFLAEPSAGRPELRTTRQNEAASDTTWSQVVIELDAGWLMARAPVPPDSVRALVAALR